MSKPPASSRLPGLHRLTPAQRLERLVAAGHISRDDATFLLRPAEDGQHIAVADGLVENAIGVLGLPVGVAANLVVNGRDYVVPMAVEEPSVVAGVTRTARLVRQAGGFATSSTEPLMLGQIHLAGTPDPEAARARLLAHEKELLERANALCAGMVRRGGGAREIEVRLLGDPGDNGDRGLLVVHLIIDTRDAMGANTINAVLEGLAPRVEEIAGAGAYLRILSNLPDRCRARATCCVPAELLACDGWSGREVVRRIELASRFAEHDPYRAATHNKGIMNGIDAVAVATGNDWRALEAGAHAFAARNGRYTTLTRWRETSAGELSGELDLPLAAATAGGPAEANRTVQVLRRLLGAESAADLREVMAAVGLAQNLAALRVLATEGIRHGQMTLYARAVALAGGAPTHLVAEVAARLVESGEVKPWRARELVAELRKDR